MKHETNAWLEDISRSNDEIFYTRNRIIHGYNSVTPDILWLTVKKSLPILKNEVIDLLE
jgi:uncharacterized protein with HEPN domain